MTPHPFNKNIMELIAKIRAEIERRKKAIHSTLFNDEYNELLSFLDTLQEPEVKPDEELKNASEKYCPDDAYPFGPMAINLEVRKAFIAGAKWKDRSLNWIRDLVKAAIKKPEEAQGILERIDRMLNKEEQKND